MLINRVDRMNIQMIHILGMFFILVFLCTGCKNESSRSGCRHVATVVDKSGLDGCTLLLQLEDGQLLNPVEWSGSEPALGVGKKYLINYEEVPMATICMTGKTVKITCITSEF